MWMSVWKIVDFFRLAINLVAPNLK
jgi:hypothetical protein